MFVNILQEISIHLKYAYESLLEESNQNSARSREKTKDKDAAELDALYSKSEATNIAEISAKIIKSSIESGDGDGEVIFFIVVESPETIVRIIFSVTQHILSSLL
jgi:hypothetical protein